MKGPFFSKKRLVLSVSASAILITATSCYSKGNPDEQLTCAQNSVTAALKRGAHEYGPSAGEASVCTCDFDCVDLLENAGARLTLTAENTTEARTSAIRTANPDSYLTTLQQTWMQCLNDPDLIVRIADPADRLQRRTKAKTALRNATRDLRKQILAEGTIDGHGRLRSELLDWAYHIYENHPLPFCSMDKANNRAAETSFVSAILRGEDDFLLDVQTGNKRTRRTESPPNPLGNV